MTRIKVYKRIVWQLALVLLLLFSASIEHTYAQGGKWMWVGGDTSGAYNYGTKDSFAASNCPPPRYECAYWIDLHGNFWIFGASVGYNDLWEYNIKLNQWVWVNGPKTNTSEKGVFGTKGVPSKLNYPTARGYGANCWTDTAGDLWLFGGDGEDSTGHSFGALQDLWRYNIASNEWTWMGGNKSENSKSKYGKKKVASKLNWPGGTDESKSAWVDDSNNLWMFGGRVNYGPVNDMWRYSVSNNEWTYMKGDNSFTGLKGHEGKINVEDSANLPAADQSYIRWKDCEGNFYMHTSITNNEVWRFRPKTNNWTCLWGDSTGAHKSYCSTGSSPNQKYENTSPAFVTKSSVMWSFAGGSTYPNAFNDLFYFNINTNRWTWVSGSSGLNSPGKRGTKGVASKLNFPSARLGSAIWTDSANNLWVFGGATGNTTALNDLWVFIPDTACVKLPTCLIPLTLNTPSDTVICRGKRVTLSFNGFKNVSVTPGGLAYADSVTHTLVFIPTVTTQFTVSYTTDSVREKLRFTLHVLQPDTVYIDTTICTGSAYILPKGEVVNTPGRYHDTLTNHNGCDSIIVTTIHIKPLKYRSKNPVICANQTYTLPKGQIVHTTGVYLDTLTSINGCDSIITTTLQVNKVDSVSLSASICRGHTYTLPKGKSVHTPGRYIDTLRNANGCDSIITTTLYVNPIPSVAIAADICTGQTYTLPDGKNVNADGTYIDTVYEQNGCDSIITTTVTVHPLPKAGFTLSNPDVIIEDNPDVVLNNTSTNWTALTWLWDGVPFWHGTDTTITVYLHGYYCITLKAFNSIGCIDTATLCLTAHDTTVIAVPAAFTPNGDGNNDVFFPITRGDMHIIEFKVYNRWGQLLYDKPVRGWDGTYNGKPQPQGTYIYIVVAEDLLNPNAPKKITQKGDVELIR